jgi:chromosome segregation ATPase
LRTISTEKNNQDARNQQLEDKLIELDTLTTDLEERLAYTEARLTEVTADRDRAEAELADLEERLADTEARLTEVTADRDRAEAELADSRANFEALQVKLAESATNMEQVQAKLAESRISREHAETRLEKATADGEAACAELDKWKANCEKALAELAEERARSSSVSSQQLDSYSAQIRQLNSDLAQRNSEVLSFVELIKKLKTAFAPKAVVAADVLSNVENDSDIAGLNSSPSSGVESGDVSSDELPQLVADSRAFVAELLEQQQQQLDTSDLRNHLAYAEERCTELEQILARYQHEAADR